MHLPSESPPLFIAMGMMAVCLLLHMAIGTSLAEARRWLTASKPGDEASGKLSVRCGRAFLATSVIDGVHLLMLLGYVIVSTAARTEHLGLTFLMLASFVLAAAEMACAGWLIELAVEFAALTGKTLHEAARELRGIGRPDAHPKL